MRWGSKERGARMGPAEMGLPESPALERSATAPVSTARVDHSTMIERVHGIGVKFCWIAQKNEKGRMWGHLANGPNPGFFGPDPSFYGHSKIYK